MNKNLPPRPTPTPRQNADFGNDNGPNFDKYAFIGFLIVGFLVVLFMHTFTSCSRTIHEATTESSARTIVRIDTLEKVKVLRDSVIIRDSVETKIFTRGDTVFLEKMIVRWRERISRSADTAKAVRQHADTLRQSKAKEYKKKTTSGTGILTTIYIFCAALLGALFAVFVLPKLLTKWLNLKRTFLTGCFRGK